MLKIQIKGVEKTINFLKTFAEGYEDISLNAVSEYLVGDERHGLKHYQPYKHKSYKEVYGGFLSDKQRRYVMAKIRSGEIEPGVENRTGYMREGWSYAKSGDKYIIQNDVSYAKYVVGETEQSKIRQANGWRIISETIKDNIMGAFRHARAMVNKWIKENK